MSRILLGVDHINKNLETVINCIDAENPGSLTLELPNNYPFLINNGIRIEFFGVLYEKYKTSKKMILLEEDELLLKNFSLTLAFRQSRESIQTTINYYTNEIGDYRRVLGSNSGFSAPELSDPKKFFRDQRGKEMCTNALAFLDKYKTKDALEEALEANQTARESVHLERIGRANPEFIIVGRGHAKRYASKLPGYRFMRQDDSGLLEAV